MATNVVLTSAMRANLSSLQGTATLMGNIQNQLATGLKINSALDNLHPSSQLNA
jgi:flagellin